MTAAGIEWLGFCHVSHKLSGLLDNDGGWDRMAGALPHTPQGSAAPLTPYWRGESSFFKPMTAPLETARTRGFFVSGVSPKRT